MHMVKINLYDINKLYLRLVKKQLRLFFSSSQKFEAYEQRSVARLYRGNFNMTLCCCFRIIYFGHIQNYNLYVSEAFQLSSLDWNGTSPLASFVNNYAKLS